MTWFKVDDSFHSHTKALKAGNAAVGLWVRCGSYCAQHLTDGFIPRPVVLMYGNRAQAAKLVEAGLWEVAHDGWWMHDYDVYNPSAADVKSERASNARRQGLHRDPELLEAIRTRDRDRCRYCGRLVNWRDRRSGSGGTYDHVDPQGPNTLGGVVTACRSCNSAKASRTPEQAQMPLLAAGSIGPPGDELTRKNLVSHQIGSGTGSSFFQDPDPTRPDPILKTPPGDLGEGRPETNAYARNGAPQISLTSENRPTERCSAHDGSDTDPGPCGGCAKARQHAERWDSTQKSARMTAIRACRNCDVEGWRIDVDNRHRGPLTPGVRCDHTAWSAQRIQEHA